MKLFQIAKNKWTVLAFAKDNDDIPLLDFLLDETKSKTHKEKMLGLLQEFVPTHGVPKNPNKSGSLGDKIFYFKTGPKNGPKVRVLFFYDEGNLIICSHGFIKDTQKTPPEEIEKAKSIKNAYFNDKAKNKLTTKC